MRTEVEATDWSEIDSWWLAYGQSRSVAQRYGSGRALAAAGMAEHWGEVDTWWESYADSSDSIRAGASALGTGTERSTDWWAQLDPWWNAYAAIGNETADEIVELLKESNEAWRRSEAPFETDPLAADLTQERLARGPLQPTNEVEWSRWLAQLLRPSGALTRELFDLLVDAPPEEVVREDQLSKRADEEGSFRKPDILVFHSDHGVSIEVKLDDEHYRKTAETAALVERHYDVHDWTHVLLLPERKRQRLDTIVEQPVSSSSDGRLQVEWETPGPVAVVHWRDVTAALRSLLRRGDIVDDHWAANAYLFCAVAEQQLLGFEPLSSVKRLAEPTNAADAIRPTRITGTLEEQLRYLRSRRVP